ncbi:hypothetical protein ACIGDI_39425 [Streptomyces sp. NPDC085900]|uniref:hypothetical protein n=1 Tax=Streptomyces sp. NPDC085900 TaxID=3365737 RepID=UPI0037CE57E9
MKLLDLGVEPEEVIAHPRHQAAQADLVPLIERVRACRSPKDGYELQQDLLRQIIAVEEHRNAFSQAVKRMRDGKHPQAGAPEPQSGLSPADIETWVLERELCERVARQFRSVGDALAWRAFNHDRRYILALCRNPPPGIMAGKAGLKTELETVESHWRDNGQFALMHDLTSCLRIGDVTVWQDDGPHTYEIKTNARYRSTVQERRIATAYDAIRTGSALPGDHAGERLHVVDTPLRTHLGLLQTATERAAKDGIFAAKAPGSRALLAVDLYGVIGQGWTRQEFRQRAARQWDAARRRARIGNQLDFNVHATSLDSVSRDPLRVPWGVYPMHPVAAARLIGDVMTLVVETSGPALAADLTARGIPAQWVRPAATRNLVAGEVVMEMHSQTEWRAPNGLTATVSRTLQLKPSEMDRYLIELLDQDSWAAGIRHLLLSPDTSDRPWPIFRDEGDTWL